MAKIIDSILTIASELVSNYIHKYNTYHYQEGTRIVRPLSGRRSNSGPEG